MTWRRPAGSAAEASRGRDVPCRAFGGTRPSGPVRHPGGSVPLAAPRSHISTSFRLPRSETDYGYVENGIGCYRGLKSWPERRPAGVHEPSIATATNCTFLTRLDLVQKYRVAEAPTRRRPARRADCATGARQKPCRRWSRSCSNLCRARDLDGIAFTGELWQRELEESFEFEETLTSCAPLRRCAATWSGAARTAHLETWVTAKPK